MVVVIGATLVVALFMSKLAGTSDILLELFDLVELAVAGIVTIVDDVDGGLGGGDGI